MAAAAKQDSEQAQDIPESFPRDQLFVAVADGLQVYAGYDGGPQHGGKGRWKVGEVGHWTADTRVPIAQRDPDDGTIWKGWLEPVIESFLNERGVRVSRTSQKFYSTPAAFEQRSADRAKREGKLVAKAKKPTGKARKRAELGAPPMQDALKPVSQRSPMAEAMGAAGMPQAPRIPLDAGD